MSPSWHGCVGDLVSLCLRVAKAPEIEHEQTHEEGAISGSQMCGPGRQHQVLRTC